MDKFENAWFEACKEYYDPMQPTGTTLSCRQESLLALLEMFDSYAPRSSSSSSPPFPPPPFNHYTFFLRSLLETVRVNIIECISASYKHLTLSGAKEILMFSSLEETKSFISDMHPEWKIEGEYIDVAGKQPLLPLYDFLIISYICICFATQAKQHQRVRRFLH